MLLSPGMFSKCFKQVVTTVMCFPYSLSMTQKSSNFNFYSSALTEPSRCFKFFESFSHYIGVLQGGDRLLFESGFSPSGVLTGCRRSLRWTSSPQLCCRVSGRGPPELRVKTETPVSRPSPLHNPKSENKKTSKDVKS